MRIGFVGAGKVGCSLGSYFAQQHTIVGYASKSSCSADEAAQLTGSHAFRSVPELARNCDMIFFTVPDGAIEQAWLDFSSSASAEVLQGKMVAHCSGAMPSTVFEGATRHGVSAYSIHPLFAVSSRTVPVEELSKAFFTIEGSPERLDEVSAFIDGLGNSFQVIRASDKTRYHAAAALASNHVVALYRVACNELMRCGFSDADAEQAMAPLFLGNAQHIAHDGVVAALTGPAERGDYATIDKHLACLDGSTKEVYQLLNEVLLDIAQEKRALHRNE